MAEDTATAAALAADQQLMMAGVLPGDEAQAEELLAELRVQLDRCAAARNGHAGWRGRGVRGATAPCHCWRSRLCGVHQPWLDGFVC